MATEQKSGLMVQYFQDGTRAEKKTGWALSSGLTGAATTEISKKILFKDTGSMFGTTDVRTRESGSTTRWRCSEFSHGLTGGATQGNI